MSKCEIPSNVPHAIHSVIVVEHKLSHCYVIITFEVPQNVNILHVTFIELWAQRT